MCGITGIASSQPVADRDLLAVMRDTMAHRGPDDAGVWLATDACVGLGHRRLSIIDLSPAGHQPMAGASGVQLAFNGEIYNYRELREELRGRGHTFHTASDSEVILAAFTEWGESFVERLEGMFALALYDPTARRLYLARDRAGEKPLFVWQTSTQLAFASELKALFRLPSFPRTLDPHALDCYLTYGYIPRDLCILQGVTKLPAGHLLIYDVATGTSRTKTYWDLPPLRPGNATADELAEELESTLASAVARQLVADVPVAVLLSGGIDSSLVTALAVRSAPHVKTFTVRFPGSGSFDETEHARLIARHFETDHIEVVADAASVDLLPLLARQYDEPIADSSMVPTYLVSRLIREHATVAVGGDGGDELFGGYPHYAWLQKMERYRRFLPAPLRGAARVLAARLPVGFRGRNYALGIADEGRRVLSRVNVYFDPATRRRLLRLDVGAFSPEDLRVSFGDDGRSLVDAAQRMDFRTYLTDDILVKVDRASMLASLETRAPFLDVRVIELAFGRVPESLKVTANERKILLQKLARRLLPPSFDVRRKQGFSIPLHRWIGGEWGRYMRDVLAEADPALFDRRVIDELFARAEANVHRIFALTMFELWRREYNVGASSPACPAAEGGPSGRGAS